MFRRGQVASCQTVLCTVLQERAMLQLYMRYWMPVRQSLCESFFIVAMSHLNRPSNAADRFDVSLKALLQLLYKLSWPASLSHRLFSLDVLASSFRCLPFLLCLHENIFHLHMPRAKGEVLGTETLLLRNASTSLRMTQDF